MNRTPGSSQNICSSLSQKTEKIFFSEHTVYTLKYKDRHWK